MSFFSDVEREVVVTARSALTDDVAMLELASSNGRPLPVWQPGAHIDLRLAEGLERQYSLCGDPHDRDRWRVAVLRESAGRGGSVAAHNLEPGRLLVARGPRSNFAFEADGEHPAIFVAGGIGITPILPMVEAAAAAGLDWRLHYAGSTRTRMAYLDRLLALDPERVVLHISDEGSRLDAAALVRDRGTARIWACGPARLLEALVDAEPALPDGVITIERFAPRDLTPPVWEADFEVELAGSGKVVTVPPELSVLEALENADALTVSSCREGTCGTCETVVLEGEVDHRDSVLTPSEQAESFSMMTCVSRAACPRLVLDL